jgi:hypothetical protein
MKALLEYLETTDSEILNQGEEVTFLTDRRQEIIDFILHFGELVRLMDGRYCQNFHY